MQSLLVNRISVLCLLLVSGTSPLHAQEQADVHPNLTSKFFLDLGIFFPDRETRVGVNGTIGGDNPIYEFDRVTGIEKDDETFALDFGWRFGKKWSLQTQYFKSTGTIGGVLTEDLLWRNVVFPAGSNVVVGQDISVIRVFFGYQFDTSPRHEFGLGLGLHQIKFGAFIQGEILVAGNPNAVRTESVGHEQPLPNIGIWYKYSLSPDWVFRSRFDWLDASIDEYDGSLINASLGINYALSERFGIGLNYNIVELDAAINKPIWQGSFLTRLDGAFIYVSAYW